MFVDNFAGGGGASTGIELAIGRPVDVAINHDIDAIRMHEVNHPHTRHYCESVWDVDPRKVANGRPIGLAWFSPDCKHFSKARGSVPVSKNIRGLAWVALRWASTVKPRIIMLENVEEFKTWGPVRVDADGKAYPCEKRKGQTFRAFTNALRRHGYEVEFRELRACDYGAPTSRKRLFMVARCDGRPIIWPEPTHGPGLLPYRTAAECIDWTIPAPSIFDRKRPLAEATLKRIAKGLQRYVIEADKPFVVNDVAPFITECANASNQRNMPADEPLRTICAQVKGGHFALVTAFLAKHYTGVVGSDLRDPISTVTAIDHHSLVTGRLVKAAGENSDRVSAFLVKYYGNDKDGVSLDQPMHTIPTRDRFGLVMVRGEPYRIVDIGMRMLEPHELYKAQGFPADYIIDRDATGSPFTKKAQVARCGNSVCPPLAEALVRANYSAAHANDNTPKKQREAAA